MKNKRCKHKSDSDDSNDSDGSEQDTNNGAVHDMVANVMCFLTLLLFVSACLCLLYNITIWVILIAIVMFVLVKMCEPQLQEYIEGILNVDE